MLNEENQVEQITVGGVKEISSGVSDHLHRGPDSQKLDHGYLAGKGDDDHTIYSKADGTRAFTGVVQGVDPTASLHLATKNYVDGISPAMFSGVAGEIISGNDAVGVFNKSTESDLNDTYIHEGHPDTNYQASTVIPAGRAYGENASTDRRRALILPVLTSAPNLVYATTATLYVYQSGASSLYESKIYRIANNTNVGSVTWNNFAGTFQLLDTVIPSGSARWEQYNIKGALADWTTSPFGFCIEQDGAAAGTGIQFDSEEGANPPYIEIEYYGGEIWKCDASHGLISNSFIGFAKDNAAESAQVDVQMTGVLSSFSVTPGQIYYLSNTAGGIATTAGTVEKKVGLGITSTILLIQNS